MASFCRDSSLEFRDSSLESTSSLISFLNSNLDVSGVGPKLTSILTSFSSSYSISFSSLVSNSNLSTSFSLYADFMSEAYFVSMILYLSGDFSMKISGAPGEAS